MLKNVTFWFPPPGVHTMHTSLPLSVDTTWEYKWYLLVIMFYDMEKGNLPMWDWLLITLCYTKKEIVWMGVTQSYEPFKSVPEDRNKHSQRFRVAQIFLFWIWRSWSKLEKQCCDLWQEPHEPPSHQELHVLRQIGSSNTQKSPLEKSCPWQNPTDHHLIKRISIWKEGRAHL